MATYHYDTNKAYPHAFCCAISATRRVLCFNFVPIPREYIARRLLQKSTPTALSLRFDVLRYVHKLMQSLRAAHH